MDRKLWNQIRNFYKDTFNIKGKYVDMMSHREELVLCATGLSVSKISELLSIDLVDVKRTIMKYYFFTGWGTTFSVNPLHIYNKMKKSSNAYELFYSKVLSLDSKITSKEITTVFRVCKLFTELDAELTDNWR